MKICYLKIICCAFIIISLRLDAATNDVSSTKEVLAEATQVIVPRFLTVRKEEIFRRQRATSVYDFSEFPSNLSASKPGQGWAIVEILPEKIDVESFEAQKGWRAQGSWNVRAVIQGDISQTNGAYEAWVRNGQDLPGAPHYVVNSQRYDPFQFGGFIFARVTQQPDRCHFEDVRLVEEDEINHIKRFYRGDKEGESSLNPPICIDLSTLSRARTNKVGVIAAMAAMKLFSQDKDYGKFVTAIDSMDDFSRARCACSHLMFERTRTPFLEALTAQEIRPGTAIHLASLYKTGCFGLMVPGEFELDYIADSILKPNIEGKRLTPEQTEELKENGFLLQPQNN